MSLAAHFSLRKIAASSPIPPTMVTSKGRQQWRPHLHVVAGVGPASRLLRDAAPCRYRPCKPLATMAAETIGSAVLAMRWLQNPATPATAPTGPRATGSHIILLPKLALSCSK